MNFIDLLDEYFKMYPYLLEIDNEELQAFLSYKKMKEREYKINQLLDETLPRKE